MLCAGCKRDITVPASEPVRTPTPPPLPASPPEQVPSPASGIIEDDSGILAYVFEDKKDRTATDSTPDSPSQQIADERKLQDQHKKSILFVSIVWSFLAALVGVAGYFLLCVDWRPPDPRLEAIAILKQKSDKTQIEINNKKSEATKEALRAKETWSKANKTTDTVLLTMLEVDDLQLGIHESDAKLPDDDSDEEKLSRKTTEIHLKWEAAVKRLNELREQARAEIKSAITAEINVSNANIDAQTHGIESRFYETQIAEIERTIKQFPDEREMQQPDSFDFVKNRTPIDRTVAFDKDVTELHFDRFSFPESDSGRFFASFDPQRQFVGERSLRVTSCGNNPITILLPEKRDAGFAMSDAAYFSMALFFPDLPTRLKIGVAPETCKIGEIQVRFGNAAGTVEYKTISPRYCDALFYDGVGKYVSLEFPLNGDTLWQRTDQFDFDESAEPANEPPEPKPTFFSRIDWIELRFVPLSEVTVFWVDGISLSPQKRFGTFNILESDKRTTERRRQEAEAFAGRQMSKKQVPVPTPVRAVPPEDDSPIEFVDPKAE